MTPQIKKVKGKQTAKCTRCNEWKYNAPMYEWYGMITKVLLGVICQPCAIREAFGSNHRNNKHYKRWLKDEEKKTN